MSESLNESYYIGVDSAAEKAKAYVLARDDSRRIISAYGFSDGMCYVVTVSHEPADPDSEEVERQKDWKTKTYEISSDTDTVYVSHDGLRINVDKDFVLKK